MSRPMPDEVDAFGNVGGTPRKKGRPRKIKARLEEVPADHLFTFAEKLYEAQVRFTAYQRGEVDLSAMATKRTEAKFFLAQDQVNAFLFGLIIDELLRRKLVVGPRLGGYASSPFYKLIDGVARP